MSFHFELLKVDTTTRARRGRIYTSRGEVETPVFMPVGTQGTVKALTPAQVEEIGAKIILANTYHLHLRPGEDLIRAHGGLHQFMNWKRPILTDSGGFQVFSLASLKKITAEGALFRSHIDGSPRLLTPEKALEIQMALGSDIMMCLDECTAYPATYREAEKSLALTLDWAGRSRQAHVAGQGALFGIVQGGVYPELRAHSAAALVEMNFDGYALGGLSVGETKDEMQAVLTTTPPLLPADKPRYLMGVGLPEDIIRAVAQGIDMFDCVIPTRTARNGLLFTKNGNVVIKHAVYRADERPIDETCGCYTCGNFSRAYLRHLFMAREILAMTLNTIHNVSFYLRLMKEIREAIEQGKYSEFSLHWLEQRQEKAVFSPSRGR